ncbi:hypothetical protein N8T08_008243 [Aspergillus melleus]|uniref:Uncharacterized protein n=1 Tax=Aspergillus melleus TaxID=138277 RepID=A0ACC3AW87_9EURO|nr:hypothetical protein N8T08_008243 [Aspergillus melleus]
MKSFSALTLLVLAGCALALPTPDQSGVDNADDTGKISCDSKRSGNIEARCAIPWTQNYGEYDDVEKRDSNEN